MAYVLTWTDAAKVISQRRRSSYDRQSLKELVDRGVLTECVVRNEKGEAIGISGDRELWSEFSRKVRPKAPAGVSVTRSQGKPASVLNRAPDRMPRSTGSDDLPDYNESRARTEFERANLLELERRQKEGLLIERKVVETTWATIITTSKTKILGIPSRIRQRIPHLTLEEVQLITQLVEETLEELSQEAEGET
jgi:hypothetical protein